MCTAHILEYTCVRKNKLEIGTLVFPWVLMVSLGKYVDLLCMRIELLAIPVYSWVDMFLCVNRINMQAL